VHIDVKYVAIDSECKWLSHSIAIRITTRILWVFICCKV